MIGRIEHRLGVIHLEGCSRDCRATRGGDCRHPPFEGTVARGAGHDPDRILLIGRAGAASWGVVSHELGQVGISHGRPRPSPGVVWMSRSRVIRPCRCPSSNNA